MPATSRVLAEFTSDLICFSSEQYEGRSVDQRIIALESIIDVLSLSYPGDLATAHVTSVERLFSHREGGVGAEKADDLLWLLESPEVDLLSEKDKHIASLLSSVIMF